MLDSFCTELSSAKELSGNWVKGSKDNKNHVAFFIFLPSPYFCFKYRPAFSSLWLYLQTFTQVSIHQQDNRELQNISLPNGPNYPSLGPQGSVDHRNWPLSR